MKVSIDTAKCAGHARCNALAPEVYDLDDDGYALPLDGEIPPELEEKARDGAESCPERAIVLA
ncbi:ferredoxin [Cryptosporangium aurantiacum]|uniref:Ferredoxin n=1 Tax=Cryptosporangium aurantiacum TaxID=134849 RepID=A0A1M7R457_9ACTN|nr:ferredoxin [Cryptosporangium aurantiacum]SHN39952.1 ferredoxin [Cryptosporangium aurantiacum]